MLRSDVFTGVGTALFFASNQYLEDMKKELEQHRNIIRRHLGIDQNRIEINMQ